MLGGFIADAEYMYVMDLADTPPLPRQAKYRYGRGSPATPPTAMTPQLAGAKVDASDNPATTGAAPLRRSLGLFL